MSNGQPILWSLYVYAPNKIAPVLFTIAFAASAVGHTWQCARFNSWKLIGLHPFCAVLYTAGYALREYGAFHYLYSNQNLIIYIVSQVLIYICPPLLELANYHVLGRLLHYVPHRAPLPPAKILSIFGGLVALVEALNGLGVAFTSNPSSSQDTQEMGSDLTIASLALQLCVIATCVILAAVFHWRCARSDDNVRAVSTPLVTLYVSMSLICIRCIYRLVEHTGSVALKLDDLHALENLTPILRYEWYFYVFEATVMFLNSILWNIWNPSWYLPSNHNVYLDQRGRIVHAGEEKSDSRPLLLKFASVLTFGIFFRKRLEVRCQEGIQIQPLASRESLSLR